MIIRCVLALFFVFSCLHPAIAQERYKFAFVTHGGPGNPFWNVVIKGMEDAAKRYGVDVQWLSNPTFSIADMPNFLDDAIANKVNGIGITCPDPEAIRESVERAHAAGIPIIVLNTADPNAGGDHALPTEFYVGASEYLGGQSNAKAILAEAEKRGVSVQRAVCPIQELGHSGLEARFAGFSSIFRERGIVVDGLTISNDVEQSAGLLRDYFLSHPQTNAIATLGPLPADAFYLFVEEEGKEAGEILHVTHDTSTSIFDHIRREYTVQAVDQQPYLQGYLTVSFLYLNNAYGLTLAQDVLTGPFAINATNVDRIASLVAAGYR